MSADLVGDLRRVEAERDALRTQVERVRARLDQLGNDQYEALSHAGTFKGHLIAAVNLYSDACKDLMAALDAD